MCDDKGLVLPRNMMANWIIKISEYYLDPIYQLMAKQLKQNNQLLHCDETTMQCNKEPGRNARRYFYESIPLLDNKITTKVVLNKKLKGALTYANNQKRELSEFLNDGQIPLTNSAAERAVRPFAVHRKNWLFADSISGANANAVMYSLIESAKINNLNIYKYINYLLEKLPQLEDVTEEEIIRKYLPWSEGLPEDILNFQCTYKELTVAE